LLERPYTDPMSIPVLRYETGILILEPLPQIQGKWLEVLNLDDNGKSARGLGFRYRYLLEVLKEENIAIQDEAKAFDSLNLSSSRSIEPYLHQTEALEAWKKSGRKGVVVLPTGAGKTYLAEMALKATHRSALIVVPTIDLMQQWYSSLSASFPDVPIGLLGGGSKEVGLLTIATYDSAAIYATHLGRNYATLIFDECHHLPAEVSRGIAAYNIAPYRLGLTATPERMDGKHIHLEWLIGPTVYRRFPEDLVGYALAEYQEVKIMVQLSPSEHSRYQKALTTRNAFISGNRRIQWGTLKGWQQFLMESAHSPEGRAALQAHREAKKIARGTEAKLRVLGDLLHKHFGERILVFTEDNETVYRISDDFLLPAITHQTPIKERQQTLELFKSGEYRTLVTSRVLNEGIDVPEASIAILLSGSSVEREYIQRLGRILRKSKDKKAVLYEVVSENTTEEQTSRRRHGEFRDEVNR
jgi:superfamily II DNA or RNA helicase